MENTKLTLNVKSRSLPLVKEYAKRQHTSVSKIVQELFDEIVERETTEDPLLARLKSMEIPDDIKSLTGILEGKYAPGTTYDDMKWEYFKDRYDL